MVELTDREKKIVMIKFIMHGLGPFQHTSVEVRENMLIQALKILGYEYDKDEMLDIGQAILDVQQEFNDKAGGWLELNKETVRKALKYSGQLFKKRD